MKFNTFGDKNKKAVLLIHPMFSCGYIFENVVPYLNDFYVIAPTLDGHDKENEFSNIKLQSKKICDFLAENGIKEIEFIYGMSLGALVAFDLLVNNSLYCKNYFLDGAPMFKFGKIIKNMFKKSLIRMVKLSKTCPEKYIKLVNKQFEGFGDSSLSISQTMTNTTINNLVESCYSFSSPSLSQDQINKLVFFYGSKEPARFCIKKLKKLYSPNIIIFKGYKHCQYILKNTSKLLEIILEHAIDKKD